MPPVISDDRPIAVLGAGCWGTALAILMAGNGLPTRLWGHNPRHVQSLESTRENRRFLAGIPFPDRLMPCRELRDALHGARLILVVVPSHGFRETLDKIALQRGPVIPLAWATKGLEEHTGKLLHEVAREVLGEGTPTAVISGPSFAREVAEGLPTAITVASTDPDLAQQLATWLHNEHFRAYYSKDVIGVELGGAVKNVLAIAAGIADGLGFGANSRAALITRGLAEMIRLGEALGGRRDTFMGLAGLGDLALTCTDNQSRNRRLGLALAKGQDIASARRAIGQEVEGIRTAQEVYRLAQKRGISMPITEQTYRVLYEDLAPKTAVHNLLTREQKSEAL